MFLNNLEGNLYNKCFSLVTTPISGRSVTIISISARVPPRIISNGQLAQLHIVTVKLPEGEL
jgi:hypothetical protein